MAKENWRNLVGVIIFYLIIAFGAFELCKIPEDANMREHNITLKYQK